MSNQTPADRIRAFLDARTGNVGTLDDGALLSAESGPRKWAHLTTGDLRAVLAENERMHRQFEIDEGFRRRSGEVMAAMSHSIGKLSAERIEAGKCSPACAILAEHEQLARGAVHLREDRDHLRAERDTALRRAINAEVDAKKLQRQLDAAPALSTPTVWWLDTGEFDYDPPRLHAIEQGARDAAIKHWRHFNPFPRLAEFTWVQEPDDDPDHPDPNRGHELVAAGRHSGHFVRPITVQGAATPPLLRMSSDVVELIRNTISVSIGKADLEQSYAPGRARALRRRAADFEQLLTLIQPGDRSPGACGKCGIVFDPNDHRAFGTAQHHDSDYCRGCVDQCHEAPAGHRCVICTPKASEP